MDEEIKIYKSDIHLVMDLASRVYKNNTLKSNSSEEEQASFKLIRQKMGDVADYFRDKYNSSYGPFESDRNSGNPITIGGNKLGTVWSTIYKGADNKQYAAQISFVINKDLCGIDVGFYFGRASSHNKTTSTHNALVKQMQKMGKDMAKSVSDNPNILLLCQSLLDIGFHYLYDKTECYPDEWIGYIKTYPYRCQVVSTILFNDKDFISLSDIDIYVSQVLFLMNLLHADSFSTKLVNPRTYDECRQKRLSEIGRKGELYILEREKEALRKRKQLHKGYPKHVADISDNLGYDILSKDSKGEDILIEVKTTVCKKNSYRAKLFYISRNEYNTYLANKKRYKIYRVYDIDGIPEYEEIDMETTNKEPDGYIVSY